MIVMLVARSLVLLLLLVLLVFRGLEDVQLLWQTGLRSRQVVA